MTGKQIIIDGVDGLSCTNCSEAKRCQEQQVKKEYAINQVLQDIPSEYANVIARLKQIIPSITRCDYVLEKQLKRKEKSEEKLVKQIQTICDFINNRPETFKGVNGSVDKIITDYAKRKEQECEKLKEDLIEAKAHGDYLNNLALSETLNLVSEQLDQLKAENEKYALFIEKLCDYAGLECDSEEQAMRTLSDLASQMNKARWIIDRYKQTLAEIKEIVEQGVKIHDDIIVSKQILQKIKECEVDK